MSLSSLSKSDPHNTGACPVLSTAWQLALHTLACQAAVSKASASLSVLILTPATASVKG